MIEGASSSIHADGSQDWLNSVRNDCNGETAMAMALTHLLTEEGTGRGTAYALCDYVCFTSPISTGPRANPDSPTYGLMQWTTADALGGIYYGDDNARSLLGIMAAAAAMDSPRWDRHLLKCLLANLRTSGPTGFRARRLNDDEIQEKGWQHFFELNEPIYHPHYESYLWACFLWAYEHTGFTPFLERARTAISMTMHAYPEQWSWTNGIQQERARMVLPLAWLVRADDTPEHREWLKQITSELLAHQDSCGAIREEIGSAGLGHYGPPKTNEDYGTSEAPLIQANGDPLCDLLYTTNFAFIGLHEAAMATGDESLIAASDRLAEFLVRVQVESNAHPELDGAWFRAFEYKRWDYWASNADLGWGAWSIESGWTQGWITAVLAMREMNTSLWDLTANTRIGDHADQLTKMMLPGE